MIWYKLTLHNSGALRYLYFFNQLTNYASSLPTVYFFKVQTWSYTFPASFQVIPIPYAFCVSPILGLDFLQLLRYTLLFPTLVPFHHPSALNGLASSAWLLQHYLFIFLEITQMLLPLVSYCWKHSSSSWCSHSTLFIIHFELTFIISNKWLFHLLDYKWPKGVPLNHTVLNTLIPENY